MTMSELTPELNALVTAARVLAPEHVRQVTDFAEFLGTRYAVPDAADMETVSEDDEVDLSGSPSSSDLTGNNWADLSGVFRDFGGHSAIGLV
jgi:hypothetical protein